MSRTVIPALFARRRHLAILLYGIVAVLAYFCAYLIRFDFRPPRTYLSLFAWTIWPLVAIRLATFRIFRLTRERWRYTGAQDVVRLIAATVCGSVIFLILFRFLLPLDPVVPISVVAAELVLMSWFTGGMWLTYRLFYERIRHN